MRLTSANPVGGLAPASEEAGWRQKLGARTKEQWSEWKAYWKDQWQRVSHPRLALASAAGAALLLGGSYAALAHIETTQAWARVYTDGTYVGMVPNEPDTTQAMQRIALGYHVDVRFAPVHTHVAAGYDWQTVASMPTDAVAIALNGKPLVYTRTAADANQVLETVRTALTPAKLPAGARAHFVGDVAVVPVETAISNILSPEAAVGVLLHRGGNRLSGRGENSLLQTADAVQTGAKAVSGEDAAAPLLQVETEEVVTKTVTVPYTTRYVDDNQMAKGQVKVVTPGKPGVAKEQVRDRYVNGKLVSSEVVSKQVVQAPQQAVAKRGTNSGVADGNWIWPSPSYVITSGFGYRSLGGGEFHPGVDIGCPVGTPVYATNNGTVEDAGWNSGGYGIWVKIDNGNGIETVFGHLSRTAVHPGQRVAKGQVIGYSGATGNVTGPHLHYEVRIGGRAVNPRPYM
ncbi:peptidoglycan DD-metalloendopeptidase family protein [Alicyclobacillus macrosporangiidus]|uniref:Murein DD-endopeptidase MepM and murein hydrolase activator NlpD, contain LysM domain n=1 Tax=Alicyclobacillus macrosporangiidus TaxID=392015 RepID=A0A1I7K1F1_9BACL|nr:peptidoglycan DD-metalloendopeptidase family protein [Alicyclobacillus macrosporangiidus]SFU91276.1 Murein DD-endopeptidase MepM and murein hydrolase activator NlpD, contain LysM domain [Alicyclobacillus macrosporangiidus]